MKHYINQFQGYTTLIVEIEDNIYSREMPLVRKELESIGQIVFDTSLNIINRLDEDLHTGWKFVVLSNQNETCIQSIIDNIAEILS
jgi:hypothetical protein